MFSLESEDGSSINSDNIQKQKIHINYMTVFKKRLKNIYECKTQSENKCTAVQEVVCRVPLPR